MVTFTPFPKIPRLYRKCVITEKLDGTNASIFISEDGEFKAGSRNRWISIDDDNYGFARWCEQNKEELMKLGPGHHFGEWWGLGIQRGYNKDEKIFSLFNTFRWGDPEIRPMCCDLVPVLYEGLYSDEIVQQCLSILKGEGSMAALGFMKPEGIMIYHEASKQYFKVTCENDERPKGGDNS